MFIIAGTVTVMPSDRDAFLLGRASPTAQTRDELGCIQYGYSADPLDPSRCLFISIWETQEAFDAHAAIVQQRNEASPSTVKVLDRTLIRYEISRVSNVGE